MLDCRIVFRDRIVEEAPRGGDLIFHIVQFVLQLAEILIGLELRIILRDGHQIGERAGQRAFRGAFSSHVVARIAAARASVISSNTPLSCAA